MLSTGRYPPVAFINVILYRMKHTVYFDPAKTPDELVLRPPKPVTLGDTLLRLHIVKSMSDALIFLAALAVILIAASIYLLASSVPFSPALESSPVEAVP